MRHKYAKYKESDAQSGPGLEALDTVEAEGAEYILDNKSQRYVIANLRQYTNATHEPEVPITLDRAHMSQPKNVKERPRGFATPHLKNTNQHAM
jgi:hypothetical protein